MFLRSRRAFPIARRAASWLALLLLCSQGAAFRAQLQEDAPEADRVAALARRLAQALNAIDDDPQAAAAALESLENDAQGSALAEDAGHFLTVALQRSAAPAEAQIAVFERLARRYPDSRRFSDWRRRYQALCGQSLQSGADLSSPAATFASFQRAVRMRDFDAAYACCAPSLQRAIGPPTFTRGVERSRASILEASLAAQPDETGCWPVTDPQGTVLARLPFHQERDLFTLALER